MITNEKVILQILLKNDVQLKYYYFRSTVKYVITPCTPKSLLKKLEISPERIDELKIRFYNLSLYYCKSKSKLKTIFL